MWWDEFSLFNKIKFIVLIFAVFCGLLYLIGLIIYMLFFYKGDKKIEQARLKNKQMVEIVEQGFKSSNNKLFYEVKGLDSNNPRNKFVNFILPVGSITKIVNKEISYYLFTNRAKYSLVKYSNDINDFKDTIVFTEIDKEILETILSGIYGNPISIEQINNNIDTSFSMRTEPEGIANGYFTQAECEKAIATYSELIKLQPENIEYFYKRARAYTQYGQLASAINDYWHILEIKADEIDACLYMAEIYNYGQQYEGTKQVLELALKIKPDDEEIQHAYNEILSILSEDDNYENSSLETINTENKIQKINIAECTIEKIQSLELFDNTMLEKFIGLRNSGKIWYDLDSFAMDLELQPHQIIELKDILIFPPKPKNKMGRKLDI